MSTIAIKQTKDLMNNILPSARQLISNDIIQSMSVIDWGKAMARANELIQRDLLRSKGFEAWDPQLDKDCPPYDTANNSPGFDILLKKDGKLVRVQSKLRQVKGVTDFSRQTHFETTRRHSKKNEGESSSTGHVAYSANEFDFVLVTLVNVSKNLNKRNNINDWSFSLIPISDLIAPGKECCLPHIPSKILKKNKFTF
tara:strand:+ start:213 stop:806 length:594 start_codon:yes stop_codon:yes gene_type:complete